MRHTAWNLVPLRSSRLSYGDGVQLVAAQSTLVRLANPPTTPQVAAVRSGVGPLKVSTAGAWIPNRS